MVSLKNIWHREASKKWLPHYLTTYRERDDWVMDPTRIIQKATLTFAAMFFWNIVRHRLSPTKEDCGHVQ